MNITRVVVVVREQMKLNVAGSIPAHCAKWNVKKFGRYICGSLPKVFITDPLLTMAF